MSGEVPAVLQHRNGLQPRHVRLRSPPRKAGLVALLLLMTIPLARHSSVLWGQFLVRGGDYEAVGESLVATALIASVATVLLVLYLLLALRLGRLLSAALRAVRRIPIAGAFLVLAAAGAAVGLVYGNPLRYIASDTYNLGQAALAAVLAYVMARHAVGSQRLKKFLAYLMTAFALLIVANGAISVFVFSRLNSAAGGPLLIVGTLYFTARARSASTVRARLGFALLAIVMVLPLLTSLKRAVWAAAAFAFVLVYAQDVLRYVLRVKRGAPVRVLGLVAVVAVVAAAGAVTAAYIASAGEAGESVIATQLFRRASTAHAEGSIQIRIEESRAAIADLAAEGPLAWAVGRGSGAVFFDPVTGNAAAHTVHLTPGAVLYRHGILGLLIFYSALAWTLVRLSRWRGRSWPAWLAYTYGIGLTVTSISAFTLIPDTLFPLLAGASVGLADDEAAEANKARAVRSSPSAPAWRGGAALPLQTERGDA